MTCNEVRARLGALLDGELGADGVRAVEAHLTGCGACRAARRQIEHLSTTLRAAVPRDPAPAALRARVQAAVRATGEAPARAGVGRSARLPRWPLRRRTRLRTPQARDQRVSVAGHGARGRGRGPRHPARLPHRPCCVPWDDDLDRLRPRAARAGRVRWTVRALRGGHGPGSLMPHGSVRWTCAAALALLLGLLQPTPVIA